MPIAPDRMHLIWAMAPGPQPQCAHLPCDEAKAVYNAKGDDVCVPHTGNFTTDLSQYGYGHTCVLVGVWVWDSRHNTLNRRV